MILKGIIEEIIYRNTDNNYTVVGLDCDGEYMTAVGKFPQVSAGESVELEGSFSTHSRYGDQFNATHVKITAPTSQEGIIKYLSSGLIKGVGPVTAMLLVDKFKEDTLNIIELNPERLTEVRGISEKKASEIAKTFNEIKKMQNAVLFLQQYNITTNMAVKIYNHYTNNTENVLKTNPYKLVEDIDGIGFYTADKIAQRMGIDVLSEFRFRAGILHILQENSDKNGNTYLPKSSMVSELSELLQLNSSDHERKVENVLAGLEIDTVIKQITHKGSEILALNKLYNIEKLVALTLNQLNLYSEVNTINVDSEISVYEALNKITMHDNQKRAITMAINNGVSVITGGPGTGKTTIVKCILQIFNAQNKTVKLLAPTGRAAKRLSESTNSDASTIHRALVVDYNNSNLFFYNTNNKLPYDVIIVDEVSMVDVQLMFYLLRAIKNGAKLILVGDKDQLPSVGAGNVLADILASKVINVTELTQIYRQSEDSLIIYNAHLINSGTVPEFNNKSKDFFFYENAETADVLRNVLNMATDRIPNFLNIDTTKIQVLAPMKAGLCGVDNLNKELQNKLNPPSFNKPEIVTDKYIYRKLDRVMQITNNYEREWKKDTELGSGVFNGDIGFIHDINPNALELSVMFEDGRLCVYNKADINELMLSYAITIHKSQGSEFEVVLLPLVGGPPMLLTRNLLYTAVTRAKQMVVLMGSKAIVRRMVKNNHTTTRFTLLKDLLISGKENFKISI